MLDDFYHKIQVIQEFDVEVETIKIINENSTLLADLLSQQLAIGKDGQNGNVTVFGRDFYADRTISDKTRYGSGLGKVTEYITNYMTGSFYKELFVKTEGQNFYIESKVPYFEKILKQSGQVIMELNEEHLAFFSENIVVPKLQSRFSTLWNAV